MLDNKKLDLGCTRVDKDPPVELEKAKLTLISADTLRYTDSSLIHMATDNDQLMG